MNAFEGGSMSLGFKFVNWLMLLFVVLRMPILVKPCFFTTGRGLNSWSVVVPVVLLFSSSLFAYSGVLLVCSTF